MAQAAPRRAHPQATALSNGRPRNGLRALPCLRVCPRVGGLYRLDCGFRLLMVDAKRIRGPGTSFLRLLPTRLDDRGDMLRELARDPALADATKQQIEETIVENKTKVFGDAEQQSAAQVLMERARREELLDMARREGASQQDLAALGALEDLEELRAAVREQVRQLLWGKDRPNG